MRSMQRIKPLLLVLVLGGCATLPPGPSVNVLPAQGKSFDTFRTDDATCRQWAQQQIGIAAQETYETNVATGAVVGTAVGTGLGAALGSASGHTGAGALIGAASGLLVGTAAGSDSGRVYGREAQRRYDNAYVQCMYSYGNQVPGYRSRGVAAPPATPPPPAVMVPPDSQPEILSPQDYPSPAEVDMDDAPQFIYSPALRLYVAVGVPYDLVFTGSDYLYLYGGRWYRGPYYNGPWVLAPGRYFPPALRRYRIDSIRHFRDVEYGRYVHDREHFDGRFHRPAFRGGRQR
ncbi:hypothetical protein AOG1_27120 [Geobacter sp. AOG1]|nr:hypothetical protein AOG1_27120 [Geobacter sp. AOG1]